MTKVKLNYNLLNFIIIDNYKKQEKNYYYSIYKNLNLNKNKKYMLFFLEQNNKNKFPAFKIFQLFTALYLQNIYKINIKEKNINTINTLPKQLSKTFLYKVRNTNFKQFNIKYFNEVGYLFLINI